MEAQRGTAENRLSFHCSSFFGSWILMTCVSPAETWTIKKESCYPCWLYYAQIPSPLFQRECQYLTCHKTQMSNFDNKCTKNIAMHFSTLPHLSSWTCALQKSLLVNPNRAELKVNKIVELTLKVTLKNRARGNRKTLRRPELMSKVNFRNLKLKSHEEYLICRTHFVQ